jgi:hypothetical protein
MAQLGNNFLLQKKYAEAETLLRGSLRITGTNRKKDLAWG